VRAISPLAIVLAVTAAASAQLPSPGSQNPWIGSDPSWAGSAASQPHPAVVRIIVPNRDGTSLGSGVLVAVSQQHGLVVTNWHVVREASGPIVVAFPDGFRSGAAVLKTDATWDLAALAIWRPNAVPIPLAAQAPRPGEPLTIAGYGGNGTYRAATGRCTGYLAPGSNQPQEMVELAAPARNGDSGGPILNARGELAGVLFGTAAGRTPGSYSGRVRWFLDGVSGDFQRLPASAQAVAQHAPPGAAAGAAPVTPTQKPGAAIAASRPGENRPAVASGPPPVAPVPAAGAAPTGANPVASIPAPAGSSPAVSVVAPSHGGGASPGEESLWDLARNVLAAIGGVAILFHTVRLLTFERPAEAPVGKK